MSYRAEPIEPMTIEITKADAITTVKLTVVAKVVLIVFGVLITALLGVATYFIIETNQRVAALNQRIDDGQKANLAMEARFSDVQQSLNSNIGAMTKEITASKLDTTKAIAAVETAINALSSKVDLSITKLDAKLEATNSKLETANTKLDGLATAMTKGGADVKRAK